MYNNAKPKRNKEIRNVPIFPTKELVSFRHLSLYLFSNALQEYEYRCNKIQYMFHCFMCSCNLHKDAIYAFQITQ